MSTESSPVTAFGPGTAIGFIGLGVMGGGMARCLLRQGHPLTVYARNAAAAQALQAEGATVADSPAALGARCRVVFLCLTDAAAVEDVLFGDKGLAQGLAPGSVVIDTSTISAASARQHAARLAEQGIHMLDAPVSGGQLGAAQGTLTCMVGGSADVFEACRGVCSAFAKSYVHVGPQGAGQTVKACNQVAVTGAMLGVAEALALARLNGVDPSVMREILLGGTARSLALERHGQRIIDQSFTPGFRASLMRKDIGLALQSAGTASGALPMTELAAGLLGDLCEGGRADWDWCAIALHIQALSGLEIPAEKEKS